MNQEDIPKIKEIIETQKPGSDIDIFNLAIEKMRRNMLYNIDKLGITIDKDLVLTTTDKERQEELDNLVRNQEVSLFDKKVTARLRTSHIATINP
jgi:hypothetical protein